jgi:hypothetical protein
MPKARFYLNETHAPSVPMLVKMFYVAISSTFAPRSDNASLNAPLFLNAGKTEGAQLL